MHGHAMPHLAVADLTATGLLARERACKQRRHAPRRDGLDGMEMWNGVVGWLWLGELMWRSGGSGGRRGSSDEDRMMPRAPGSALAQHGNACRSHRRPRWAPCSRCRCAAWLRASTDDANRANQTNVGRIGADVAHQIVNVSVDEGLAVALGLRSAADATGARRGRHIGPW